MLIEMAVDIYLVNIYSDKNWEEYLITVFSTNYAWLVALPYFVKQYLFICFFLARTFEQAVLSYFMRYQKVLRLSDLEVARDNYQNKEKLLLKLFVAIALFSSTFPIMMVIDLALERNTSTVQQSIYTYLYFSCMTVFLIALYNATCLSLIKQMYLSHRLEFLRHAKSMLILFIATELSLINFLWMQVATFYQTVCESATLNSNTAMVSFTQDDKFCQKIYNATIAKILDST